jgi:hypothetical protein
MSIFQNQGYFTITLETGVDLTSATVTQIKYVKPDGTKGDFEATVTDTTKLTYQFTNEDLDKSGNWKFQAYVIIGGLNAYGAIVNQRIEQTL